eukprot:8403490-Ditylum_brightwellii.AAC.1
MVVLDPFGGKRDSKEYLTLGHYFSMIQNIHYFQKPIAGNVKMCNMTISIEDMDADVLVKKMKRKQYNDLQVPTQHDGVNCGVYVPHYATCKACHTPYDLNFKAENCKECQIDS